MRVKVRIAILFTLLVVTILTLVCGSVYYFSYANRIKDIRIRLTNRAITTGRLLSLNGTFDPALVRKIDSSTSLAMKDKVIEAYDTADHRIYWYSDIEADTLTTDRSIIHKAERSPDDGIYFTQGKKDAVAYYYHDTDNSFIIFAAAFDETGVEKLHHLRLVLSFSFIGGILISVVGGYLFSISLLRPLRKIADEVNEISARNLTRRIRSAEAGAKDEWKYLTDTLNQLLNRLQESFEIQGRFITNASHELSTPLTSISSQLEVALQRIRTLDEYKKVIASVYQDVQQLNKLTQILLEFARASGTASGLSIDLTRIDEILLRLPADIAKNNPSFNVILDFEHLPETEDDLLVFCNEELLFTAIRNIVSNACKYSDDHQTTVRLDVSRNQVRISVADNGRGIPPEEIENIFQPFYRTEEGHAIPGFGLGLPLARRIVQLHKGRITVDSTPGKGSVFTITLPPAGKL
jgi:signal transduction histidine kinase